MEDRINRRRFLGTGIAGVTTIAAGWPSAVPPSAASPDPDEGERIVDATVSGGTLHVLVANHGGRHVRFDELRRGRRRRLDEMTAIPLDADFEAIGLVPGAGGLVGAMRSTRQRTFETELRWELPDSLRHLTDTTPTSGHATVTELVWEPAAAPSADQQPARVDETTGTFGHVIAGSAPGRSRAGPGSGRMIAGLGVAGQLVADVVRVALIEHDAIIQEAPVAHDETVVAAYVDADSAIALIRRDADDVVHSLDLSPPGSVPRQEVGVIPDLPRLARWRDGIVMITVEDGGVHTRRLTAGSDWVDAALPSARRVPSGRGHAAIPIDDDHDVLLIEDADTVTVVGN